MFDKTPAAVNKCLTIISIGTKNFHIFIHTFTATETAKAPINKLLSKL